MSSFGLLRALASSPLRRRALAIAAVAGVAFASACTSATTGDVGGGSLARVQLSDSVLRLRVGAEGALAARVLDASGQELSGRKLFWSVRDSAIATVSQSGVVTGRAPGSTLVSANVEGRSGVATVIVSARPVSVVRVEPTTLQLVAGATAPLQVRALDEVGGEVAGSIVAWTSSDTTVARVASNGVVTAAAPGIAVITAIVDGRSAVVAVSVSPVAVANVSLTAARDTLVVGASTQLTLVTRDAGGALITNRPTTWASDRPNVASVSSTGEVLAVSPGTATIEATVEGRSARVALIIVPRPAAALVISPDASTIFVGATLRLLTLVTDASGNVLTNRPIGYSSSDPSVASVDTAGVVTARVPGNVTITATSEGKRGTATVRVLAVPVATVTIAPEAPAVRVGDVVTLTATPRAEDGTALTGRAVTWSSGAPGIASVSANGEVRGLASGTALILARVEGASGTVTVRVDRAPAASVTVSPATASIVVGDSAGLGATVRDASGALLGDRLVTWSSASNAIATVSNTGVVKGVAAGTTTVRATVDGVSGSATVTITAPAPAPAAVASVLVTPPSASVAAGATVQLSTTVRDANGNALTGRTITWSTSNPAIASVSTSGVVTGVAAGAATITATSEGRSGTAAITVTGTAGGGTGVIAVASVAVSPSTLSVVAGGTGQLSATARDASGNALTGRTITWSTSNPAVATVSTAGVVTAVAAGSATISATSEGQTGSAAVTVTAAPPPTPAPVVSVAVSPSTLALQTGATGQLSATPRDASGNALTGRTITWSTSNASVATVSSAGVVTAVGPGSATITATSEGRTGSAAVTVTAPPPAPVASVAVSPSTLSLLTGATGQLSATPRDATGTALTGRTVTWASSNTAVATVSSTGVVTAVAPGSATVTATSEGRSGSAAVTVTAPPPAVASVRVTPDNSRIEPGQRVTLSAEPLDAQGRVIQTTLAVTWTSSNPLVAVVSSSGQVTGLTRGDATITATIGGRSGSALVRVRPD
ncbi:beta strand repeat-containing protein [Roseisolibacter agri]|nr:Ig-like domain-containing protein [Roseisolibacter agri]